MSSPAVLAQQDDVLWSYEGIDDGQHAWAFLSNAYKLCEEGTQQSPIDIAFTETLKAPPLDIRYYASNATIYYNNRTIEIAIARNATLTEGDTQYRLKFIRLRSPAEHTVKKSFHPLEVQLVHEGENGVLLILSVFGDLGAVLPELNRVIKKAPDRAGIVQQVRINPAIFLPSNRHYYAYSGSLSYPPCTEGVEWRVLKTPFRLSQEQLQSINKISGRNARLTQPVYLRKIIETIK